MVSVLGRLMQKEFGRKRYREYCAKLKEKECMDIFCDIYFILTKNSEEHLSKRLLNLLQTVQLSVAISRLFGFITIGFVAAVLFFFCMPFLPQIQLPALCILIVIYGYKTIEFLKNRYCDNDVRLVLIYKAALFHLLSNEEKT
ncbi:MAG: hypothetical protein ACI4SQ_05975 [Eubacterium sp.]